LTALHTLGIEHTTNDVIADTWKILNATAADHDHRVLLKVVTLTRNVADNLETVRKPNLGHLTHGGVRLLWRRRVNTRAHTPLLRVCLHSRNFIALYRRLARLADQLTNGRHQTFPCSISHLERRAVSF